VTAKRLLDVTLSGFGLLLSAPLWVLIAAAVKLEDGGRVVRFVAEPHEIVTVVARR